MTIDRLSIGTLRHAVPADVPAIHAMTQTAGAGYQLGDISHFFADGSPRSMWMERQLRDRETSLH